MLPTNRRAVEYGDLAVAVTPSAGDVRVAEDDLCVAGSYAEVLEQSCGGAPQVVEHDPGQCLVTATIRSKERETFRGSTGRDIARVVPLRARSRTLLGLAGPLGDERGACERNQR